MRTALNSVVFLFPWGELRFAKNNLDWALHQVKIKKNTLKAIFITHRQYKASLLPPSSHPYPHPHPTPTALSILNTAARVILPSWTFLRSGTACWTLAPAMLSRLTPAIPSPWLCPDRSHPGSLHTLFPPSESPSPNYSTPLPLLHLSSSVPFPWPFDFILQPFPACLCFSIARTTG